MFRPEGSQPRLAIIFCGQGKLISNDEKMAWHQKNAWLDQYVYIQCCEKALLPFVIGKDLCKFVLLLDNLKKKMQDDFKESVSSMNGLL